MVNCLHVIDQDVRRRARVSHELHTFSLHAEIYENVDEFLGVASSDGLVLVADDPGAHGQNLSAVIKTPGIDLPVIGYSEDPSTETVVDAMLAGAAGFLRWPFDSRSLIKTLNRVSAEGDDRLQRDRMLAQAKARVGTLSRRESQVLRGLIGGLSNKQIGLLLEISPRTVEIHRSHMMSRLRANSVGDAVRIGLYAGLDEDMSGFDFCKAA